jgi:hypothetical protein
MPLLPLETWRNIMGYHPYHFWQLASSSKVPVDTGCNTLVWSYPWLSHDAASRQDVTQAIENAEQKLAMYLGYAPAPRYTTTVLDWPVSDAPWGSDGRWLSAQLPEGWVQAIGTDQLTLIGTPALVYTDPDGDGLFDTWTATIATSVTDISQIAAYFAAADRLNGDAAGDTWRIQPITVTISAGIATIRGRSWQLVKPILYEGFASDAIDPNPSPLTSTYVATLDIYQRTTNMNGNTVSTSQGVITWETRPCHGWWCCCDSCCSADPYSGSPFDPAATAQAVARVGIRDARHGLITPAQASYDSTTQIWSNLDWNVCSQPDRVTVRYLAGFPLGSDGLMQEPYRTVVARLAAADLARNLCGCEQANRALYYWQFDLSQTARGDELFGISPENLNNPLGTRRGQVHAWKFIMDQQQLTGILA